MYSCGVKDISKVFLCGDMAHFAADYSDKGWGCGYRNAQMLLSSLLSNTTYQQLVQDKLETSSVPSVPKIQSCIESAWKEGILLDILFLFSIGSYIFCVLLILFSFPLHLLILHLSNFVVKDSMLVAVNNLVASYQIQRNGLVLLKLLHYYAG